MYEKHRNRIEQDLAECYRVIEDLKREPRPEELASSGDNTPLTEDGDNAVQMENEELRSDRLQRVLQRAKALEDALVRIDEGTYGICIDCGRKIPQKRLEAVPEAIRCVEDQDQVEAGSVPERTTL